MRKEIPLTSVGILICGTLLLTGCGSTNGYVSTGTTEDTSSSTDTDQMSSTDYLDVLNSKGTISWSADPSKPLSGQYPSGYVNDYLSDHCSLWVFSSQTGAEEFKNNNFQDMYKEIFTDAEYGYSVLLVADFSDASCYSEVRSYFQ